MVALAVDLVLWLDRSLPDSGGNRPAPNVAHLRRGALPVVSRELTGPPKAPTTGRATATAPSGENTPERVNQAPPRQITLDDLEPTVRASLAKDALAHLHDLVEACEGTVSVREDLGAFLLLDHQGVATLDLRPIAKTAGPIVVEDRPLSADLVACLDDALWAQDWNAVGEAVAVGNELPVALTMRLNEDLPAGAAAGYPQ